MLRLIHLGLGGWGRDWERNVLAPAERAGVIERVAAVEVDRATLSTARETLDLPEERYFTSLAEAAASVSADAVLATVPLPAHVPVALEAIGLGLHVLVEKPFAPTLAEAEQVVAAGESAGRVVMVSQNYRPYPAVRAVVDLLRGGELGPVGAVHVDFRKHITPSPSSPYGKIAQPLLEDMAIHHFDLMRLVLGREPVRVACEGWNPPGSTFAGIPAAAAAIAFDGGAVVSYRGSWVSPGPETTWAGDWRVECERGEVVWTSREGNLSLAAERVVVRPLDGPGRTLKLSTTAPAGRAGVLAALARANAAGEDPGSSGRDNLGSIALMTAAVRAATEHRVVEVERPAIWGRSSVSAGVGGR